MSPSPLQIQVYLEHWKLKLHTDFLHLRPARLDAAEEPLLQHLLFFDHHVQKVLVDEDRTLEILTMIHVS